MTRCDYDSVFYRVFCITLLSIAFTFTIILTNVFVDLDDLLTSKKPNTYKNLENTHYAGNDLDITFTPEKYKTEVYYEDTNYGNVDYDNYRTKRSLDPQNFMFHIKDPKMKSILTSRLSTLLEDLDAEETASTKKTTVEESNKSIEKHNIGNRKPTKDTKEGTEVAKKDDLLHLAMHNILLQGIIRHMDLNEVYKRVHSLAANFNEYNNKEKREPQTVSEENTRRISKEVQHSTRIPTFEERKFMEELMNCKELQNDIMDGSRKNDDETRRQIVTNKSPKVMIKTIIDITSNDKRKKENETNSRENIKGIIKLIYNGKSIKFSRMDDDEVSLKSHIKENNPKDDSEYLMKDSIRKAMYNEATDLLKDKYESHNNYNKFINDYLKLNSNYEESSEVRKNIKRLKRHIKIRYENDDVTENPRNLAFNKDDDDLYVEIETHFNSKGMKGEKKKKLIRSLIEKIQKAIHSNGDEPKKRKQKYLNVKKRTQHPLNNKNVGSLVKKMILPYQAVVHRHLDPIVKSVPIQEPMPYVTDKLGENWKKTIKVPGFLSASKAINSAEMSEVDVDYSKILSVNGIPQRLQKPLYTDLSKEMINEHSDNDLGNIKFLIKDIDGSGFSVGFNQYVDEPPDTETMKLFTGLENILRTYHQTYDQEQDQPPLVVYEGDNFKNNNENNELKSEDTMSTNHAIVRRSTNGNKHDRHTNEYKIFDSDFLPYDTYQDIYNTKKANYVKSKGYNHNDILNEGTILKDMPLILDQDVFNKNLKPAEIFSLANLLERQKRSLNVKKICNLKSKIKINRFLNTKAMTTKTIFLKKKRNKRQIDKIRIIATDDLPNIRKHSDDDIFLVSDENMFADRAIVKEVDTPGLEHDKVIEDHYDLITPYVYEEPQIESYDHNAFGSKSRRNSLMSRYPHIFMEEIARSKEEDLIPDNSLILSKMVQGKPVEYHTKTTTVNTPSLKNVPLPKVEEIVNSIVPQNGKTNYKLTVKILPKNASDMNSGFKEIHTSINKSYNKNGLLYSSLVNVSEISKIIKVNDTEKEAQDILSIQHSQHSPSTKNLRMQQEKIILLLKQHKDRIDEQLNHLSKEKQKLEHLTIKNVPESNSIPENDFVDLVIPSSPPKIMHLRKDEVNNLAAATIFRLQEGAKVDSFTVLTTESTTEHTTTKTTLPVADDEEKRQIMRTVQRNENLTNEILKKIDRNTEILQMFLQKLVNKLEVSATQQATERPDVVHPIKFDLNVRKNFNNNIPAPFSEIMPNMQVNKNNTHFSIPFVYAYQQPYPLPVNKPEIPVASVVYHGHIHTNTIQNQQPEFYKEKEVKKVNNHNTIDANQTRFFIDELETDYKMYPVNQLKKDNFSSHTGNATSEQ